MVELTVNLTKGLLLKNPVLTASGTFGYGEEFSPFVDLSKLGGFIVKGTTLEPREGNPYPRMVETPSGMLNAVGLQNKGVDYFISQIYPKIASFNPNIIVNVSGKSISDYVQTAEKLSYLEGLKAIELNISCPNVRQGGMAFGTSCEAAAEVVKSVRNVWKNHLMVKLSPNVTSICDIASTVEQAGADSISLINTLMGMAIDVEQRRPYLSTITGGLSGPAIRPVAVRMVWQVSKVVNIPIVGLGGIMCGRDALEFIMAGASAIQIGTANFVNPEISLKIIDEITAFCEKNNITDLSEIRGII